MEERTAGMVTGVPMKAITVRMGADVYARVKHAAEEEGISISQYLRETALARTWFNEGFLRTESALVARCLLAVCQAAEREGRMVEEYLDAIVAHAEGTTKPPAPRGGRGLKET